MLLVLKPRVKFSVCFKVSRSFNRNETKINFVDISRCFCKCGGAVCSTCPQVLRLLYHLVKFGYYQDWEDVQQLLPPMLSLLDGRKDFPFPKDKDKGW